MRRIFFFPVGFFLLLLIVLFNKFFLFWKLPIPADILVGVYYPFLDYKYGFITGVPVKNPMPSDVISIMYPSRLLGMDLIKSGQLPLWDPNSLLGTPLLANPQAAILNPANVLFFILPFSIGWSLQVILQPFLIFLFTYLFLSNLKFSRFTSFLSSLMFSFSGFVLVWMGYNTIGFTVACIPLIFMLIDKIVCNPNIQKSFYLALAVCMQFLSGYPQLVLYTVGFGMFYFLYRVFFNRTFLKKKIMLLFIGVISGICLSSVQLLPSFELLPNSVREIDTVAEDSNIQFLPLENLITFFAPDFFGHPATHNYWGRGTYDNFAFSLPTLAIVLIILTLINKQAFVKKNLIFPLLMIISLILATDNLLSNLLVQSNVFGLKSAVATRILIFMDFGAVVLAAIGLESLIKKQKVHLFPILITCAIYLGLLVGIFLVRFLLQTEVEYYQSRIAGTFITDFFPTLLDQLKYTNITLRNILLPSLFVFTGIFSLIFFKRFPKVLFIIFFIIIFIDIYRSTNKYITFTPAGFLYPQTEVTDALKENLGFDRFEREDVQLLPANTWSPYQLKAASGQNAIYPLNTSIYLNLLNGPEASLYGRYVNVSNFTSPLFATLDVKYLVVLNKDEIKQPDPNGSPSDEFKNPQLKEFKNIKSVRILENTNNLGLAWFSQETECVDQNRLSELLRAPEYNPDRTMYTSCLRSAKVENKGSVRVVADTASQSIFETNSSTSNYLHISKAYNSEWKAWIDGKPTTVYQTNIALMSVLVPDGNHKIVLKYQPGSFFRGVYISLFTLLTWIVVLIMVKKGKIKE